MLSQKEITDAIVQMTLEYTEQYFDAFQKNLDKQLWAALHVGFITGMKLNGYSQRELMAALESAQAEVARVLG
jgi:hypothetical protein